MSKQTVYGWAGTPVGPPAVWIPLSPARVDSRLGIRLVAARLGGNMTYDTDPKSREDFGSCWNNEERYVSQADSAETKQDSQHDILGFRLAHDAMGGAGRAFLGSSGRFGPLSAREQRRYLNSPPGMFNYLGFRLVRGEK